MDPIFQELKNLHFSNPFPSRRSRSRPASPPPKQPTSPICQALTLHGIVLPIVINFPLVTQQMANNPWGVVVGPLNLAANNNLPKGVRDVLPKFSGDGKISFDEHLNTFNVAYGILVMQNEDVAMRLFFQTLVDDVADCFYHLPHGLITTWDDIKT